MDLSDDESEQFDNAKMDVSWLIDNTSSDESIESISERECIFAKLCPLKNTTWKYGESFLESLIKSSNQEDKETLNNTITKILKNDYDVDLQYLISHQVIDHFVTHYDGMTALSYAATFLSIKSVFLLLKNMTDSDVERYNDENLLYLESLISLPTLNDVENTVAIVELFQIKNVQISLKNMMVILVYLVHNDNDCNCRDTNISFSDLCDNICTLISYGSSTHIKNVIHKIRNDITSGNLELDMCDFYIELSRPLGPGIMFDFYVDQETKKLIEDVGQDSLDDAYPMRHHHGMEWIWMEGVKLKNNISLPELLKQHPHDIYEDVKNLDFFKICEKLKFSGEYIKGLKAKSLTRHQVIEFIPEFVKKLLPPIPYLCFDKIMFYISQLSNEDLLNMCKASLLKED